MKGQTKQQRGGLKGGATLKVIWGMRRLEYEKQPNTCTNCQKALDWKVKNNKFCTTSCAASFNNRNRISLPNKSGTKVLMCGCGVLEVVNIRDPSKECAKCKSEKQTKVTTCKTCGGLNCDNKFCRKGFLFRSDLVTYFGFDTSTFGSSKVFLEIERVKAVLDDLYTDRSIQEIAEQVDYKKHTTTLHSVFKILGIKIRSASENGKKALLNGRANLPIGRTKFKTGWHTTWQGKSIFYRSSYELTYAIKLDESKTGYDVEALRIEYWDSQKNCYRVAVPDFYLSESNTIVEIKSTWTYDPINMKDKIKKYKELGYDFKLVLDKIEYNNAV